MNKLTFREYLESKQHLKKAIAENPVQTSTYNIVKYCKLTIGEKPETQTVTLKPNQTLIVEWQYEDVNDTNPTPVAIRFQDVETIDSSVDFDTPWTSEHIIRWLNKNTSEI